MRACKELRKNYDMVRRLSISVVLIIAVMTVMAMTAPIPVKADGFDYNAWLTAEQAKYPAGKYWNHVGLEADNSEGYTESPCSLHGVSGVNHVTGEGGCTCNHFGDPGADATAVYPTIWHLSASQCMGFAYKLGYDLFGSTKWSLLTTASDANYAANVRVGDIIRISGHSSVVISKSTDNKVTVAECNYTSRENGCVIAWGREIDLASVTGFEYYERAANYDGIIAGTIAPTQPTTEATTEATTQQPTTQQPTTEATTEITTQETSTEQTKTEATTQITTEQAYTGWRLAEDGVHYQYVKQDEVLEDQWLTLKKKKYYLDEDGYRVTGLYKINKNKYYFNEDGVLQKSKWVTADGASYYVGISGFVLESQWLYKGKKLVYVKNDGAMAKNEMVKILGSTYYFNASGKRSKGFKKYDGQYYYCNSYGIIQKKRWINKGGKKYYVNKSGVRVQDQLIKIDGSKYYFNEKGVLQKKKEIEFDGEIYKADKYGRCKFVRYVDDDEEEDSEEEL